jgi:hypothetical protein
MPEKSVRRRKNKYQAVAHRCCAQPARSDRRAAQFALQGDPQIRPLLKSVNACADTRRATKEGPRSSLRRLVFQNAPQPLGNGFPLEDQVAVFKHRHLQEGFTQIIIVEDPNIGQLADGGLEVR